jgi:L-asparaginase
MSERSQSVPAPIELPENLRFLDAITEEDLNLHEKDNKTGKYILHPERDDRGRLRQELVAQKATKLQELISYLNNKADQNKKTVPIVGTGGTFQSAETDEGLAPTGSLEESMEHLTISQTTKKQFNLPTFELFNIDSSQMNARHWKILNKVFQYIIENTNGRLDGLITTHGTDTMNLGACYTSFMQGQGLPVPIIFTGSQIPARKEESDASRNLTRALNVFKVIERQRKKVTEVLLICGSQVIRATKAHKRSDHDEEAYVPFDDRPLLNFRTDADISKLNFSKSAKDEDPGAPYTPFTNIDQEYPEVAEISLKGLSAAGLRKQLACAPVAIVELMGSATAPDAHAEVISEFYKAGKMIILVSPFTDSQTKIGHYKAGGALAKTQIPCINGTREAIMVKTNYLRAHFKIRSSEIDEYGAVFNPIERNLLAQYMTMNYVGEWEEVAPIAA